MSGVGIEFGQMWVARPGNAGAQALAVVLHLMPYIGQALQGEREGRCGLGVT